MPTFHDPDVLGRLMDELDATIYRIEDTNVDTDELGRGRHNDPNKAELSRDLLRAQDLAKLIEAELSVAYWRFKGYGDPRKVGEAREEDVREDR
jgi:hypothetical protein